MRGVLVSVVLLAVVTACGGGDDEASITEPSPASTAAEPSESVAPALTPKEICPEVEAGLPDAMIPKSQALDEFIRQMDLWYRDGDVEAQNALKLLRNPTIDLYYVIRDGGRGKELTDVLTPWIDGISAFAKRCKAAGSSALQ